MSTVSEQAVDTARGGSAKSRSNAVYGIRGLAALALLTVHVAMFSGLMGTKALGTPRPPSNFLGAFFVSGMPSFIGVMFVLPALYLYLPLAKSIIAGTPRPPQRNALLRRLLRLLPAYYVMYLVVLLTLNRDAISGVWFVLRPIFLLQVYLPTPFAPNFVNGMEVTWTVPSMVQWYLFLPLIAWASHRFAARGATPLARARRLLLPVPILMAIGIGWLFFVKANHWDNRMVFWWPQGFAPTIAIGLGLAVLLALSQVSPKDTAKVFHLAAARPHLFWLGALVVYIVNCIRPFSVIGMDAIYSTSGLLVTYLMVALFGLLAVLPLIAPGARPHLVSVLLSTKPVVHLGRVSYGIYLWHFAVMHFYLQPGAILSGHARPIREFYGTVGFWELELVTVAGAVGFATISYYLLEQPVGAWGDRLLRDRRTVTRSRRPAARLAIGAELTVDEASVAIADAVTDRDAIRSNLVDLESSLGRHLLAGSTLTGVTQRTWQTAAVNLTTLWETFTAYSLTVDEAAEALRDGRRPAPAELTQISHLLTGPSIRLVGVAPPLAHRHITDNGVTTLSCAEAVTRMNKIFRDTVDVVTTTETVWNGVAKILDAIGGELEELRQREPLDPLFSSALDAAAQELGRLRTALATDPLSMWRDGRINPTQTNRLRQDVRKLANRAQREARLVLSASSATSGGDVAAGAVADGPA